MGVTAQDQQSREAYEDGKWYWVEHDGWGHNPPIIAPARYRADCDSWYSFDFSGITTRYIKVLGPCELQAARALPAGMEPAASINTMEVMGGREVSLISLRHPLPAGTKLYTAAQVLAMGRVPPGCVAVERKILEDASESLGNFVSDHGWGDSDMAAADNLSAVLAAAPRPPAAQKRYRLLVRNVDTIRADDEFLRDADSTWRIDPCGIFVGMPYMSNALLPARRAIEPTP